MRKRDIKVQKYPIKRLPEEDKGEAARGKETEGDSSRKRDEGAVRGR